MDQQKYSMTSNAHHDNLFFLCPLCTLRCQPNICVTSVGLASVSDPSRCCVLDVCVCMYSTCSMHVSERNRVVVKGAPVCIEKSSLNSSIFEQPLNHR